MLNIEMKIQKAKTCATCEYSYWFVAKGDFCKFHKEKIPTKHRAEIERLVCFDHKFYEDKK